MPIYENRRNAENHIRLGAAEQAQIIVGLKAVARAWVDAWKKHGDLAKRGLTVAFEGWYGIAWPVILAALEAEAKGRGLTLDPVSAQELFVDPVQRRAYKQTFITDDPGFGKVNRDGTLEDLVAPKALGALQGKLKAAQARPTGEVLLVWGPGSAIAALRDLYDLCGYFDKTADPMLWDMWNGDLVPFGSPAPEKFYGWKEYYYCDFYLLNRQKNQALPQCDYWVEAINPQELKMVPLPIFEHLMAELSRQPLKQVKTYSPGPWGAYRYRDLWDIPGLECNAWNRLAGADLAMIVSPVEDLSLTMPSCNLLMAHGAAFTGSKVHAQSPGHIPLEVWLDDGFFPEPQPAERTSMPIHNHPGSQYVKDHFKEPLGRYETYYIAEAYPGANTWMGFTEGADLEAWEEKIRKSWEEKKPIPDWQDFIANWQTKVGDLFLIPPGTTHAHGGNQMVLEMDTCPSVAGCEYPFFGYDFMRPTWDDNKKAMTGKPMGMHLEHYLDNEKWCRADWVQANLRAAPMVITWTKEYCLERFSTLGPMPFEIERLHFERRAEYGTHGRFLHALTLTTGSRIAIRSLADPGRCAEIEKFQTALIPASFGAYELVNLDAPAATPERTRIGATLPLCSAVLWRLKEG